MRRKKKAVHKANTMDDKRLQSTLKRLGVNNIPGIEEVRKESAPRGTRARHIRFSLTLLILSIFQISLDAG